MSLRNNSNSISQSSFNTDIIYYKYNQPDTERINYEKKGKMYKINQSNINYENHRLLQKIEPSKRHDKFGNPIIKKKKAHKISFADQFPNLGKLSQVNKVLSLKTYNLNNNDIPSNCFMCLII